MGKLLGRAGLTLLTSPDFPIFSPTSPKLSGVAGASTTWEEGGWQEQNSLPSAGPTPVELLAGWAEGRPSVDRCAEGPPKDMTHSGWSPRVTGDEALEIPVQNPRMGGWRWRKDQNIMLQFCTGWEIQKP